MASTTQALILSDDARDTDVLQPILAASGYTAASLAGVDATVERTLRETDATLVLAHIDLKRDTLAQPGDVAVLGMLLSEPAYRQNHTVVVLSRTPEMVSRALGAVLTQLHVPVLALPCASESACAALTQANTLQHGRDPVIAGLTRVNWS